MVEEGWEWERQKRCVERMWKVRIMIKKQLVEEHMEEKEEGEKTRQENTW